MVKDGEKKSRVRETLNLSTDADSSTETATFGVHFWPSLLGSFFDRHFWGPLLAATFGVLF